MSDAKIGIAVILSAYDKTNAVINKAVNSAITKLDALDKKTSQIADKSFKAGKELTAAGFAVGVPLYKTIEAYANLEDAQLSLESNMLGSNGRVASSFNKINQLAIDLGNKLPGNTADFYQLFTTMEENGARAEDILNGTGKAAAYLAVQLKLPYTEAGELAERLQVATGTANEDMMAFMDTLARVKQLGPSVSEMQMAFQRSAGELKTLKIQGLQATQQLSSVYAILIRTMGSGEKVGTGFAAMLSAFGDGKAMKTFNALQHAMGLNMKFTDKKGDFLGIENMMMQFEQMKNLTTAQKNALFTALVGSKGGDNQIVATLVNGGIDAYRKMQKAQADQASLNQKVELQLTSTKNQYDAVKGSIENTVAAMGSKLKPELTRFLNNINNLLPKIQAFVDKHPQLIAFVLKAAAGFTAVALAGGYLSFVVAGVAKSISMATKVFNGLLTAFRFVAANPIILIIAAIAAAAYLIYKNWEPIKKFFIGIWDGIKKALAPIVDFFAGVWDVVKTIFIAAIKIIAAIVLNFTPVGLIYKYWDKISAFFGKVWNGVKTVFGIFWKWIKFWFLNFTPVGLIYKYWDKISAFFQKVWDAVKTPFIAIKDWIFGLGKTFYEGGKNIITSIYKGIKSVASMPFDAVNKIVGKVRNLLPFSPAKEGPLTDIHKIKLVETIAASIKPKALIDAWQSSLGVFSSFLNQSRPSPVPAMAGAMGGGGGVVIEYKPTINYNGSGTQQDFMAFINAHKREMGKFLDDYFNNKQRVSLK